MDPFHRGFEKIIQIETYIQGELAANDIVSSIFCGGIAGIVAKTAVAPAERVKMSFQISKDRFSFVAAFARANIMIKDAGIFSLWRGHSTTIIRVAPFAGISYASHDYTENAFKKHLQSDKLPIALKFIAGSVGGFVGTLFTYPLDVLRVRLALIPGITWVAAITQGGLFQGLSPTLLGIIPYSGTCWGVKQTLKEAFNTAFSRDPHLIESLTLNSVAGLSGQFVTYPLDIVRRRMQMQISSADEASRAGQTIRLALRNLYASEGLRGLFKGFSLNIIKGPITLSLSLTTYDTLRAWIQRRRD